MEKEQIESQNIEVQPVSEAPQELDQVQLAALKEALEARDSLKKELETKKYLVDLDKKQIEQVKSYILEEVEWKHMEGLGVLELEKHLNECAKNGKLFLDATALEAAYYYLTKVTGKGTSTDAKSIPTIGEYINIVKPFKHVFENVIAKDAELLKKAEWTLEARAQGIDPDASVESQIAAANA